MARNGMRSTLSICRLGDAYCYDEGLAQIHFPPAVPRGWISTGACTLGLFVPIHRIGGRSVFELAGETCAFLGLAGLFMGTCAYSTSAFAEVEEDTSRDQFKLGYSIPTLSRELMTNFLLDNYDSVTDIEVETYLPILHNAEINYGSIPNNTSMHTGGHYKFVFLNSLKASGKSLIPEAV